MKFAVKAMAVDPATGNSANGPRVEIIDTEKNVLFRNATTPWEVEDRYTAFWNRLNDTWEFDFPWDKEKVVVLSVKGV